MSDEFPTRGGDEFLVQLFGRAMPTEPLSYLSRRG